MIEKELLILVHYVVIGHRSATSAKEYLRNLAVTLNESFRDEPKYRFKHIIYPIRDEANARVECIFPTDKKSIEQLFNNMKTVRIEHDDNQLDVIDKIDELLKEHNLSIEYIDPEKPKDGYEEIYIKKIQ